MLYIFEKQKGKFLTITFYYICGVWQLVDQEKIHNQCLSDDPEERIYALGELEEFFDLMPDKEQAWNDLHRLTSDEDSSVRSNTAEALDSIFSQVPDQRQAWNDLQRLTNDEDSDVRLSAAFALGSVYSQVPDKQQAWNDLIRLSIDEDDEVRSSAAKALSSAFSQVPDKQQAWNNLHRLTNDRDRDVRSKVASSLAFVYSLLPDKQQAWNDLHRLAYDENDNVRSKAVSSLGAVFSQVPDKQQAWNDLHKLSNDQEKNVRVYANHSLGRVFIFKASQAEKEEDYKKELEKAIEFFEKAAQESSYNANPSEFCLPFYLSFHTIIFKKEDSQYEVDKYLAEAKHAIKGSKSKELLFEAVENLAEALKEVQNSENLCLKTKKSELNFYRQYCERASELIGKAENTAPSATQIQFTRKGDSETKKDNINSYGQHSDRVDELLRDTEETAPFAIKAMRKGLPILDRNLKSIIEEIKEKAEIAYKESKGTDTEEIACSINREVQKLEISSQEKMQETMVKLLNDLESMIPDIPENKGVLENIKKIRNEKNLVLQYEILQKTVQLIPDLKTKQDIETQKINDSIHSYKFNIHMGGSLVILGTVSYFILSSSDIGSTSESNISLVLSIFLLLLSLTLSILRRR